MIVQRTKKWSTFFCMQLCILIMLFLMGGCKNHNPDNVTKSEASTKQNDMVQSQTTTEETTSENTTEEENNKDTESASSFDSEWKLLLVNADHAIPDNYYFEMVELDNGRCVDSRMYPDLQEMFDEMRNNGIYPIVGEGYRSAEDQQSIMDNYINMYIDEGYSNSEAEEMAKNIVAVVGHSEHQLGLAVDINADDEYSIDSDVYTWLAENAYQYGFILRYPEDKTDITGIDFEPWHYRYVGKKAAMEIYSQNICLEEYLNDVN